MGARFDRLRCEVFQNLFLSPMNTGFVRPAVATVLTVYGIETFPKSVADTAFSSDVATVLTVYGIETMQPSMFVRLLQQVATVLTVYGIETAGDAALMVDAECRNSTYRLRY